MAPVPSYGKERKESDIRAREGENDKQEKSHRLHAPKHMEKIDEEKVKISLIIRLFNE